MFSMVELKIKGYGVGICVGYRGVGMGMGKESYGIEVGKVGRYLWQLCNFKDELFFEENEIMLFINISV